MADPEGQAPEDKLGTTPPAAEASSQPSSVPSSPAKTAEDKVEILFKATGDAPIIKKKKWAVPTTRTIGGIMDFLRKYIKCGPQDSLFLYVHQSFSPAPDVEVGSLYDCFGADGKLVLHYCKTQAWG